MAEIDSPSGDPFHAFVQGVRRGDFSALAPYFDKGTSGDRDTAAVIEWITRGRFDNEPDALNETLTCACFLGCMEVATLLLARGVDPAAGNATGLNALHWAADRGHLDVVNLLIRRGAPLEARNHYGGTALGQVTWSAMQKHRPQHPAIIEALLAAGARVEEADYPTGHPHIDAILDRHRNAAL